MTHQELDARSLALHRLVAEKIRRDPALLRIVRENLSRWRRHAAPTARPYVEAWERLLDAGLDAALAAAAEDSERAAALRQSSPFAGVLTPRERWSFLEAWSAAHAPR